MSLVISKDELRWGGRVECKTDSDWIRHCTMMEVEGDREDSQGRHDELVLRRI